MAAERLGKMPNLIHKFMCNFVFVYSNISNTIYTVHTCTYRVTNKLSLTHALHPIHPNRRPYLRVMWIHTLLYPGSRGRR